MRNVGEQLLVGLDVNASRARAVAGSATGTASALALDGPDADLPMAISLEARRAEVGRAGASLCRRSPHLACTDFLVLLGEAREWVAGRHRLDAARALELVFERLQPALARASGFGMSLPAYVNADQAALLPALASKARLRLLGSLPTPLAVGMTAYAQQPWCGPAVVVDVDDHALTWSAVLADRGRLHLLGTHVTLPLRLAAWKERLLNAVADRCIRQSRRDPRDCAPLEQSLYEQLDHALAACRTGQVAELKIQQPQWYQNLLLSAEEMVGRCAPLAAQAVKALHGLAPTLESHGAASVTLVTAAAASLPGLVRLLEDNRAAAQSAPADAEVDFGESLLESAVPTSGEIIVLDTDAAARAVQQLAWSWHRGELTPGHFETTPLPAQRPVESGLPRLHFHGRDYVLHGPCFVLGRHNGCDLVFAPALYPNVAQRHCEIVLERWGYLVRDRGPNGTLVNQRPVVQEMNLQPGDWIRLGADGPLLRFLGQPVDKKKLMTTA